MRSFLDKIFLRTNNLEDISKDIRDLTKNTPAAKIFDVINSYYPESEIRYVGGCIRKIINIKLSSCKYFSPTLKNVSLWAETTT